MIESEPVHHSDSAELERMLKEVTEASTEATWVTHKEDKEYGVTVSLPHESFVSATLFYDDQDAGHLYIDMIKVNDQLQGKGIGPKLLEQLVNEGKKYEAIDLQAHITGHGALKAFAKVVGNQNLDFYNRMTGQKESISLEESLRRPSVDFLVKADLSKIDTSRSATGSTQEDKA